MAKVRSREAWPGNARVKGSHGKEPKGLTISAPSGPGFGDASAQHRNPVGASVGDDRVQPYGRFQVTKDVRKGGQPRVPYRLNCPEGTLTGDFSTTDASQNSRMPHFAHHAHGELLDGRGPEPTAAALGSNDTAGARS